MSLKNILITASIGSIPTQSYNQKTYIPSEFNQSIPIERIIGNNGGSFILSGSNVIQEWSSSISTPKGLVTTINSSQEEFINGELSGSFIQVTNQRLIDQDCIDLLSVNEAAINYRIYLYFSSGSEVTSLNNFLNMSTSPNTGEIYLYWIYNPPTYVPGNNDTSQYNPYD